MARILVQLLLAISLCMGLLAAAGARDNQHGELPGIAVSALPPEARTTLLLIRAGGPFPYRRDGIEFQNRERRLPAKARGYYREYTVPTPGSYDRGARRMIAGEPGEYYYTPDHYRSFARVTP